MKRYIEYSCTTHAGKTIREFLKDIGYSRHLITLLKNTPDSVTVKTGGNVIPCYLNHILSDIETLCIVIPEKEQTEIVPVNIPLNIIYEDEDILVLNKPANMPIHPSINNYENTLANAVTYYYKSKGINMIFRCITRLDRDTTGIVIIAKNILSSSYLSQMLLEGAIKKTYIALCEGELNLKGVIDAPIARKEESLIERCVDFGKGDKAITEYEKLASITCKKSDGTNITYSLAKINLPTGRTHQIRVHFKYINHPLPGDFLYNPNYEHVERQALHSYSVEFKHPITNTPLKFTAKIPEDIKKIIPITYYGLE